MPSILAWWSHGSGAPPPRALRRPSHRILQLLGPRGVIPTTPWTKRSLSTPFISAASAIVSARRCRRPYSASNHMCLTSCSTVIRVIVTRRKEPHHKPDKRGALYS